MRMKACFSRWFPLGIISPLFLSVIFGLWLFGAVLRHGIISEKWDGRFISDHYPVLAEVVVREKG
jgi:hypothetical protein